MDYARLRRLSQRELYNHHFKQGGMPMMWLIILGAVLLFSLVAILYAIGHAMDYNPEWDEEDHHDHKR